MSRHSAGLLYNRYISADVPKSAKLKKSFAAASGEMYPVRLCLHILPDAFLCGSSRFLAEPRNMYREAFGFFLNVPEYAAVHVQVLFPRMRFPKHPPSGVSSCLFLGDRGFAGRGGASGAFSSAGRRCRGIPSVARPAPCRALSRCVPCWKITAGSERVSGGRNGRTEKGGAAENGAQAFS